ncbi:hypothetical protein [Acidocella sp.]|uniref:hypothetical protein n=1 Tax=Acidocella sp. TaxID=50710 RepID=UPI003D049360
MSRLRVRLAALEAAPSDEPPLDRPVVEWTDKQLTHRIFSKPVNPESIPDDWLIEIITAEIG